MTADRTARRVRTTRALDILTIACVLVAAVLFVWPTSTDVVATAAAREPAASGQTSASAGGELSARPAAAPSAENDSLISAVVNGNVFSATRRAPRTRFMPPGERSVAAYAPAPSESMVAVAADDSLPRLSGIVAINGERQALLQFVAADEAPKLYRINDTHAGYRVVQIGSDRVVLASRGGTRTVRLSHPAPPDSLEKQP